MASTNNYFDEKLKMGIAAMTLNEDGSVANANIDNGRSRHLAWLKTVVDKLINDFPIRDRLHIDFEDLESRILVPGDYMKKAEILRTCATHFSSFAVRDTNYSIFSGRLVCEAIILEAPKSFYSAMKLANDAGKLNDPTWRTVEKYANELNDLANEFKSFNYKYYYHSARTLEGSYLLRIKRPASIVGGVAVEDNTRPPQQRYSKEDSELILETPVYMTLRIAVGIHSGGDGKISDFNQIRETFCLMVRGDYTHATPTMFSSGLKNGQLSSCFLLSMTGSDIKSIYETLKDCATIASNNGGIGVCISNLHSRSSGGAGVVSVAKLFNAMINQVNKLTKRKSAVALYIEPWHAEIFEFLDLRKNTGGEEFRARDVFTALWVPDLLMRRAQNNEVWSLMCPSKCPGLSEVHGKEFDELYEKYEAEGRYETRINAQDLFPQLFLSGQDTGTPYVLFKDTCNLLSNQQNLGTIRCSNLCAEIIQYSSEKETATCNLASVSLNKFVTPGASEPFDFNRLRYVIGVMTRNLNKVIDNTTYPTPQCKHSNMLHRPIGIGVQGLADVFMMLDLPYVSAEAKELNRRIFETIYFAALDASSEIAKEDALKSKSKLRSFTNWLGFTYGKKWPGAYSSFDGSPLSTGRFHFDLLGVKVDDSHLPWSELRIKIAKYGVKNSLLTAIMPTVTTAQILNNFESAEPIPYNFYQKVTLFGEFQMINVHLVRKLKHLGLWNDTMKNKIILNRGSIQNIDEIPTDVKHIFRTIWEMPQKEIISMAVDRGAFVDQSQSTNLYFPKDDYSDFISALFYGWRRGLKTGMYYMRTKAASNANQFIVDDVTLGDGLQDTVESSAYTNGEPKNEESNNEISKDVIDDERESTIETRDHETYAVAAKKNDSDENNDYDEREELHNKLKSELLELFKRKFSKPSTTKLYEINKDSEEEEEEEDSEEGVIVKYNPRRIREKSIYVDELAKLQSDELIRNESRESENNSMYKLRRLERVQNVDNLTSLEYMQRYHPKLMNKHVHEHEPGALESEFPLHKLPRVEDDSCTVCSS